MRIKDYFLLVKHLGIRWLVYRGFFSVVARLRLFERRMPLAEWADIPDYAENILALGFVPDVTGAAVKQSFSVWDAMAGSEDVVRQAEAILAGKFRLFSHHSMDLGFPPDWHANAMSHDVYPKEQHWARIHDFAAGDIKCVWEISRFAWAFTLARAYARTHDNRYAEGFWLLFENWLDANPPNHGVNWKCGQEASFRLFAAAFARSVFAGAAATTSVRLRRWRQFVAFTAVRIHGHLHYALSQNNNHGISECVGLVTAVTLLPEMSGADGMLKTAKKSLSQQLDELVYSDGGFSQHSTVYHRVVMNTLTWHIAMEKQAGRGISEEVRSAAARLLHLMHGITDPETGLAPLHGYNDGSEILQLSSTHYLDFRPAVALLAALLGFPSAPGSGPHEEALFWLSLSASTASVNSAKKDFSAAGSGWFMLHGDDSRLFCYAPEKFLHRPAQADLLHCDLWWHGLPITRDPGTFSYNATGRFAGMFSSTSVHNTVTVDDVDQMRRFSRFLFLPWPKVREEKNLPAGHAFISSAYASRGVQHCRRIIRMPGDEWHVEDEIRLETGRPVSRHLTLHWLLADYPCEFLPEAATVVLHTPAGDFSVQVADRPEGSTVSLTSADENSERGWWSPFYCAVEPALSFRVAFSSCSDVKIVSILKPVKLNNYLDANRD